VLRELIPERLLLVATVLACRLVLGRDEVRIAEMFDRIEPLIAAFRPAAAPCRRAGRSCARSAAC
jgi:hypothetical protein